MDKKEIRNKLLLEPVDFLTLSPFVLGTTAGIATWAMDMNPGIAIAAFLIPSLISVGIYANRLIFDWDKNYERIVNDWRKAMEKKRDEELDQLYRDLKQDGEQRTENLLQDLRTLTKALTVAEDTDSLAISAFDIVSDVDKLFQRSVDYLKESLELWKMADQMQRESIKNQLLQHREVLINEVEKSLENLGTVLGSVKKASINSRDGQQLAELREELSTRLQIAEEVEEKMQSMRRQSLSSQEEEKYLKHAK